jgi:hypothetical protein
VTIPKLPLPPRSAQNSSGSVAASTVRIAPAPDDEPDSGARPCAAAASITCRQRAPAPQQYAPRLAAGVAVGPSGWFRA